MRRIVLLEVDGTFRLNLEYFRHHRERISYEWENGEPTFNNADPKLPGFVAFAAGSIHAAAPGVQLQVPSAPDCGHAARAAVANASE